MTDEETIPSDQEELQPIPEEVQDLSIEELLDRDYEVIPSSYGETEADHEEQRPMKPPGRIHPPGRTGNSASIEASSEDPGGSEHGYSFTAGYDSQMATRIGDEEVSDPKTERLRELHEGRHRTDGEHSIRESARDRRRIPQGICSSLPLSTREREAVIKIVDSIDYDQFGNQKGIPGVTLGVVAVVVDEELRDPDALEETVQRSDEFRHLRDAHDLSMSDFSTVKQKVRECLTDGVYLGPAQPVKRDPALPGSTPLENRPHIYWEQYSAEQWFQIARRWEEVPSGFKEALPQEYRERVDQLRRWKPWEDESGSPEPEERNEPGSDESGRGENPSVDEEAVDLAGVEEEAEALLDEMRDEEDHE